MEETRAKAEESPLGDEDDRVVRVYNSGDSTKAGEERPERDETMKVAELLDLFEAIVLASVRRGETTTDLFWDCDCTWDYIHTKAETTCRRCGFTQDDGPDSRPDEVLEWLRGNAPLTGPAWVYWGRIFGRVRILTTTNPFLVVAENPDLHDLCRTARDEDGALLAERWNWKERVWEPIESGEF